MYSADLSLFVLDAGIRLVEQERARLLYLSLSDYVQHGHAPDEPEALDFHRASTSASPASRNWAASSRSPPTTA